MAIFSDTPPLRLETSRSGPFTFQLGLDHASIEALLLRVGDAHARFRSSPLSQVASRLEKEVVVSSIFGTNSIEGGALSENETQRVLELTPSQVQDVEQRRAVNIKAAYDLAREAANTPGWELDLGFILRIHVAVTAQLPHEHNQPGILRDNPKGITTYVGDEAHGGRYKPPQAGKDIRQLLDALIAWNADLKARGIPVLIRAPLVHYYYELIHPFWDGNGRVGRVIEATLLLAEGYEYAPFAQARYYLTHIDKYFALFNNCRRLAENKKPNTNIPFVVFFLEGMLASINGLHDRVNHLIGILLFESQVRDALDAGRINQRQYAIVKQILTAGVPVPLAELRREAWYMAIYAKRTDKTKQRDLAALREQRLIRVDKKGQAWPGYVEPSEGDFG